MTFRWPSMTTSVSAELSILWKYGYSPAARRSRTTVKFAHFSNTRIR